MPQTDLKIDVFVRVRNRITLLPGEPLTIGKLAEIATEEELEAKIKELELGTAPKTAGKPLIISALEMLYRIKKAYPQTNIHFLGGTDTLIFIEQNRKTKQPSYILVFVVALLLFVGSAMAIMNFHADVSMPLVHQRVYYLLTGKVEKNPLVLQIPYSIGVGMGLLVFFNHAFKRKFNEEPSPLEVEMFLYQQNINKCMVWNKEEQESEKESRKKAGEQNA